MKNKSLTAALIIKLALVCLGTVSNAATESTPTVIDGVWELEEMSIVDNYTGYKAPWCEGAYGVIIYTQNYMSTAVNCTSDPTKVVLYSGPFEVEGNTVYHHAINYSNPGLNKVFERNFDMVDENHLVLRGDLGDNQVVVKWTRR